MKILALGDPHGKLPKNLDFIVKKNKIDFIVCVGDVPPTPEKPWLEESWKGEFSPRNSRNGTKRLFETLCSYGLPVFTLKGNMFYSPEDIKFLRNPYKSNKNLFFHFNGKEKNKGAYIYLF